MAVEGKKFALENQRRILNMELRKSGKRNCLCWLIPTMGPDAEPLCFFIPHFAFFSRGNPPEFLSSIFFPLH
jgi:hypothetical protein